MKVLVNKILPREAFEQLSSFAEPILFSTQSVVDEPLAGHVDIFCAKVKNTLVLAPNTPKYVVEKLEKAGADFVFGETEVTNKLETLWAYNVLIDSNFCVCNTKFLDIKLQKMLSLQKMFHVKQGFSRCSAISVGGAVLTSDVGIYKVLKNNEIQSLLVSQEGIELPGYRNG